MFKSLHHLASRTMQLIVLVALFAVGSTASAERYFVDFTQAGVMEFSDGPLQVIAPDRATAQGVELTTVPMDFILDPREVEGIGQIVLNLAPNTPALVLKQYAGLMLGDGYYRLLGDKKLVFVPDNVTTDVGLIGRRSLGVGLTVVSAEVYTAPTNDGGTDIPSVNPSDTHSTLFNFKYGLRYSTKPTISWKSINAGNYAVALAQGYYTTHDVASLHVKSTGNIYYGHNDDDVTCLELRPQGGTCSFDIIAPAGYALAGIDFLGPDLGGLNSSVGALDGNMDRHWTPTSNSSALDRVNFTYSGADAASIERIQVRYSLLPTLAESSFAVNTDAIWPVNGQTIDASYFPGRSFMMTLSEGEYPFTSVQPQFNVMFTCDDASYECPVTGYLMDDVYEDMPGSALAFEISIPESIDLNRNHYVSVDFPMGVFNNSLGTNRAFCVDYQYIRNTGNPYGLSVLGSYPQMSNVDEGEEYQGLIIGEPLTGVTLFFGMGSELDYGIEWAKGTAPNPSDFVIRKNDEIIPTASADIYSSADGQRFLIIEASRPLEGDGSYYDFIIPAGVIKGSDGTLNKAARMGLVPYELVSNKESAKFNYSPAPRSTVSEISSLRIIPPAGTVIELYGGVTSRQSYIEYKDINGNEVNRDATVTIEDGSVVYTFMPLVAGVDVPGNGVETAITVREPIVICDKHIFPGVILRYNFTDAYSTVDYTSTLPEVGICTTEDIYSQSMNPTSAQHGVFIAFGEPLYNSKGSLLAHGANAFEGVDTSDCIGMGVTPDVASFDCGFLIGAASVYNKNGQYGLFIPLSGPSNLVAANYRFVIPMGKIFFAGGKVNSLLDLSWNVLQAESEGTFCITNLLNGLTYQSISQIVVDAPATFSHVITVDKVSPRIEVEVREMEVTGAVARTYTVGASGAIVDGKAVFTLDQPITTTGLYEFTIKPGALTTSGGATNNQVKAHAQVNENYATKRLIATNPVDTTPCSVQKYYSVQYLDDRSAFLVRYDTPLATASGSPLWNVKPDGFSFTYTPFDDTSEPRDLTGMWNGDVLAYNGGHISLLGIALPVADVFPGKYHLVIPEGAYVFTDGTVNAAVDVTWTMLNTINGDFFEVTDPIGDARVYDKIDHLLVQHTHQGYMEYGDQITIKGVTSEPVRVGYNYIDDKGQSIGTSVNARVSLDPFGVRFDFEEPLTEAYPVEYTFHIRPGAFYCENGYWNDDIYTSEDAPYHVQKPYYFWLSGETVPQQQSMVSSLSEFCVKVNDRYLSALGQNQTMTIVAIDGTNKQEVVNGEYAPKSATITTNDKWQSVLTVVLPDEVAAAINQHPNELMVNIRLAGYSDEDYKAGVSSTNCFVLDGERTPNAPADFFFMVDSGMTYTYQFHFDQTPNAPYTVAIGGQNYTSNADGFVNIAGLNGVLDLSTVTVTGAGLTPDNYELVAGRGWYNYETRTMIQDVRIVPAGFAELVKVTIIDSDRQLDAYDSVPLDELANKGYAFSYYFDRDIDDSTFDPEVFKTKMSVTDASGKSVAIFWASASANWLGYGLDGFTAPFEPGFYFFHLDERVFRFADGSWNPAIDQMFVISEGDTDTPKTFQYLDYAAAYESKEGALVPNNRTWELPGSFCSVALAYDPDKYNFDQSMGSNGNFFTTVYTTEYPEGIDCFCSPYSRNDAEGNPWLILTFNSLDTMEPLTISQGQVTYHIPAGAFKDVNDVTNEEMNLWLNIADYFAINIYLNNKLTNEITLKYTKKEDEELPWAERTQYDVRSGDRVSKADYPTFIVPTNTDPFYRYDHLAYDGVNYNIYLDYVNSTPYYISDYAVDGNNGLRSATLTFNTPIDARAFHKTIQWSDGFRLKQKRTAADGSIVEMVADTDIAYATTSVSGQSVTLNFFTSDGSEVYLLDMGYTYYLEIPVSALFVSAIGNFGGLGREINGLNITNLGYELRFGLEAAPEIVTGDAEYDGAANRTFVGKANSLAEILLMKRRNGARTNDINGDGNITISDIVRLINRQMNAGPAPDANDAPATEDEYPEGWHPVAVGSPADPGDEAL